MRAYKFRVTAPFASFRMFYTTSAQPTLNFPPKSALNGLIAGMAGFKRDSYYTLFDRINYSVVPDGIPEKFIININLSDPGNNISGNPRDFGTRYQLPKEFMYEYGFTMYMFINDDFIKFSKDLLNYDAINIIEANKKVYSPYLGSAFNIANIDFHGAYEAELLNTDGDIAVKSIVRLDKYKISLSEDRIIVMDKNVTDNMELENGARKSSNFYDVLCMFNGNDPETIVKEGTIINMDNMNLTLI